MQTFLPFSSFSKSAAVLDNRRLNKQRIEAFQILNVIRGVDKNGEPKVHKGWVNHPATVMWRQYPTTLALYGVIMCREWTSRGFKDNANLYQKFFDVWWEGVKDRSIEETIASSPWWLGKPDLHESHQSNLLRKDHEFYGVIFTDVPDDLPYVWYPEFDPAKELTPTEKV